MPAACSNEETTQDLVVTVQKRGFASALDRNDDNFI